MASQHQEEVPETHGEDADNVIQFAKAMLARQRQPRATDDELEEFRKYWPRVLAMLEKFDKLESTQGCPVMRGILGK